MERTKWVERRFEFNLPVGVFPCVLERLRGTPARLEELVRGLSPGALTRRAGGAWSIQEQVGHLLDLDELHEGRLEDYDRGLPELRPADMSNRKTHEAGHNSARLADLLAAFREARAGFVRRLEGMDEEGAARAALHPRLRQPMRVIDLALFVAEHDDHHLAGITEIIQMQNAECGIQD
ncbi:MAG TPA: DinB family protein [Pyrinomonadaceae bacterium]|nr:DinB family protein [Pyrinomonadaceae bacterium]